jgi:hypothetical protein
MLTARALKQVFAIATALLVALTLAACDDPPTGPSDEIEIDAESRALDERIQNVRDRADERVASPDKPDKQSDRKDDAPAE